MDFSRYLIATDLDGTFLGPDGHFVARNIEAVARFQAGGGLFTFSTGRVHLNIYDAVGDPRLLLNAPCVMSNGAYLYDFEKNTPLFEELMEPRDVAQLVAFLQQAFPQVQCRVSTPTDLRVERTDGYLKRDLTRYDEGCVHVSPMVTWRVDDWYKIVFRGDAADIGQLREALVARFGDRFSYTASGSGFLEVQSPTVNKAAGLDKLRRLYGGDRILIACGDFENDMEMLQAADVAICPENAMDAVKKISHRVLCHCKDGLIADVVEKIEAGEL